MSHRLGVVALAVVLGLLGTGAVAAYVQHADARASSAERTTAVFAAKAPIPAGTTAANAAEQGLVEQQQLPAKLVPVGAVTDLAAIANLVAVNDIAAHQVLLGQLFGAQTYTGALTIPAGQMAVSVQLGDPQRVAGFVTPGSQVAIFDTYSATAASASTSKTAATGGTTTRLLLPRVQVIAVGPVALTKSQPGSTVATTLLTLALDQHESEQVIQASQSGKLYFALLSDHSKVSPSAGIGDSTLFQ
jgi:pilus assembly protein CpaB